MLLAPAGTSPALVLPPEFAEAVDLARPILVAGPQPGAVIILLEIEAQGVED